MRRTTKLAIATAATAIVGVVSCDGGGGALVVSTDGWDYDRGNLSQRERPVGGEADRPSNSAQPTDQLPDKKDNPPVSGGGSGGGVFVCSGIYECIVTGRSQTCVTTSDGERDCTPGQPVTIRVRIQLQEVGGVCFIGEARLEPNGTLRGDDEDEVGTWSRQGNGIYIQAGESSGVCVPSSGPVGLVGADGQTVSNGGTSGSGSGSTGTDQGGAGSDSSGQGNISIDPGTGEGSSSSSGGQ